MCREAYSAMCLILCRHRDRLQSCQHVNLSLVNDTDPDLMDPFAAEVPTSLIDDGGSRSGERETPWIFKRCSTEASKLISLLMLPMHGSVVFRKLGLEVDPAAVAKKQQMQEKKAAKDVSVKSRVFAELRAKLHENEQLQTDPVDEAGDDAAEDVEMTDDVDDEDPEGQLNPRKRKMTDQQAQGGGVELASGSGKKAMLKSLGSGYSEEEKKYPRPSNIHWICRSSGRKRHWMISSAP